jgi:Spy/CpxP family protein refolding chaperone
VNSWKVILATIVIFAAGVLTGGILIRQLDRAALLNRPPQVHPAASQNAPTPTGMRVEFLRRAQRELALSPEQREQVDKLLKESQERSRKIMEPVSPQLRQEFQRTREEFRGLLTPEQQLKFDEVLKKHPRDQRHQGIPPGQKEVEATRTNI